MISRLRGYIVEKSLSHAVIEVNGIGFKCGISSNTSSALPPAGSSEEAVIYTLMQVREDSLSLYGFSTPEERSAFERLVNVSGVGPKLALAILSTFSVEELGSVLANGDEKRMSTVPGVGKKTASRLILELKDAFKGFSGMLAPVAAETDVKRGGASKDAQEALLSMGFSSQECEIALTGYTGVDDAAEMIRYALKRLGGLA